MTWLYRLIEWFLRRKGRCIFPFADGKFEPCPECSPQQGKCIPFATLPQEGQKYRHKTTGFIATCTGRTSGGAIFSFLDLTEPSDMAKVKDYQQDDFELIEPEFRA